MKRTIRPEEDDTPRTQSDALRSSDNACSSDYFRSDDQRPLGASFAQFVPQQNLEENARIMESMMGDMRLYEGPRPRQLKSGSVVTDQSTLLQHHQVARISAMAHECRADGRRELTSAHVNAYARLDVALPAKAFPLGSFFKGFSSNEGQVFFEVPITVGDYPDGRPDETIVIKGRLYKGPDGNLWIHLMNVGEEDADLVNAAVRRVIKRMEASLAPGNRIRYQLPKFQVCLTYKLPSSLTRDDVDDLQAFCAASPALMHLQREVQTKPKAPQLLMLRDQSWKAQVNRGFIIVHEWLLTPAVTAPLPLHLPAVDAILNFVDQRSGAKRAHVQPAAADEHHDNDGSDEWLRGGQPAHDRHLQHAAADSNGGAACAYQPQVEDAFFMTDLEPWDANAAFNAPDFPFSSSPLCDFPSSSSPRSPAGA